MWSSVATTHKMVIVNNMILTII